MSSDASQLHAKWDPVDPWACESLSPDVSPTASPSAAERMSRPFQGAAKPVLTLADHIQMMPDQNGHHIFNAQQDESNQVSASDPDGLVVDPPSENNASLSRTLNDDFDAKFTAPDLSEIDLDFAAPPPPDARGSHFTVAAATPHKSKPADKWCSVVCSCRKPNKQSNAAKLTKLAPKAANQKAANTGNSSATHSAPALTAGKK